MQLPVIIHIFMVPRNIIMLTKDLFKIPFFKKKPK